MFDWFRRKELPVLEFPDNDAAFAHACKLGYPLRINALIPALVMEEGRRGGEGERWYRLHLAAPGGIRDIWGSTLSGAPAYPETGDLVAFRIVRIATDLPADASLIGYIACRLEPTLMDGRKWRVAAGFTPDDLKPELHM